ncbi:hypothetical protein ONZ45_g8451 [Pleurotus djamor]|nr:hypothetical protein ONZ45_g8451 [Pleurotus djamor]
MSKPRHTSSTQSSPIPRINSLPREILSQIFLSRKPPSKSNWSYTQQRKKWYYVAAVCRHWRQVALDTPRLWAFIHWDDLTRAEEAFERSKKAPLNIDFDGHAARSEPDRRWALAEKAADSSRIHELFVTSFSSEELVRLLLPFSKVSAPQLERLYLSSNSDACVLDSTMLWREVPALQSLSLYNVFVPAPLPNMASLSRLEVASPLLTVDWLLEALHNMPNVHYVDARTLSDEPEYPLGVTSGTCPKQTRVALPSLRHLHLSTNDLRQTRVLQSIDLPKSFDLHLVSRTDSPPSEAPLSDLTVIQDAWTHLKESVTSRTHTIIISFDGIIDLSVSTGNRGEYSIKFAHLVTPTLSITPAYLRLCQCLPLSAATVLNISITPICAEAWCTLLPSFTNISSFQILNFQTDALLSVLYNEHPSTEPFLFPFLTDIQIHYAAEFSQAQFERLKTIIEQRDHYGESVDTFVMTRAKIPEAMWDYFEERNGGMDGWMDTVTWELMDRHRHAFY